MEWDTVGAVAELLGALCRQLWGGKTGDGFG